MRLMAGHQQRLQAAAQLLPQLKLNSLELGLPHMSVHLYTQSSKLHRKIDHVIARQYHIIYV